MLALTHTPAHKIALRTVPGIRVLQLLEDGAQQQRLRSLQYDVVYSGSVLRVLLSREALSSTHSQVTDQERSQEEQTCRLHGRASWKSVSDGRDLWAWQTRNKHADSTTELTYRILIYEDMISKLIHVGSVLIFSGNKTNPLVSPDWNCEEKKTTFLFLYSRSIYCQEQ